MEALSFSCICTLHSATENHISPFHNQILVAFNQSKGDKADSRCQVWKLLFISLVSTSNPFYLHTEHRNMPLDDAMRLVGQNFDQYMQDLRERAKVSGARDSNKDTPAAIPKDEKTTEISSLLSKAATGADLSAEQLTKLIDSLSKRQEEILGSSTTANGKGGKNARHDFFSCSCCRQDYDFTVSATFYSHLYLAKLLEIENGFLTSRRASQHTHPPHLTFSHTIMYFSNPSPGTLEGRVLKNFIRGGEKRVIDHEHMAVIRFHVEIICKEVEIQGKYLKFPLI